jgi:hypothetical protein
MSTTDSENEIIFTAINFIRSITVAYSNDEGMKLWNQISEVLDPSLKGKIFFALLTGERQNEIIISGVRPRYQKVNTIKLVRNLTNLGLKECKDLVDSIDGTFGSTNRIKLEVTPANRNKVISAFREYGCII